MTWQDDAGRDLVRSFGERMAMFVRGEGSYLWDADDKRYLDFLAGIAVDSLGHAHPVFVDTISRQAATLAHVSNYFATPPQLALAAQLKRLAGTGMHFISLAQTANESDPPKEAVASGGSKEGQKIVSCQSPNLVVVPRGGIEPPTRGFSVRCSTN